MSREVLKMALEVLGKAKRQIVHANIAPHGCIDKAITALKAALAQPVQPECLHDETERLGAIWIHCTQCGKKWADDEIVPTTQPAQPEQEPVAWWDAKIGVFNEKHFDQLQPLYTSPPQRQPLTNEQRLDLLTAFEEWKHDWNAESILIDMVEAAHDIGEKT